MFSQEKRDAVESNLKYARDVLSRQTSAVVTVFHARQFRRDCGLLILFNAAGAKRHGGYDLVPLASFRRGKQLPAMENAVA